MFWENVILVSCLKLILIPTYFSTDFEVHRNWLAITHSLPIKKWYYENTSEWTLDYPPLFAWFEYFLSQIAKYFDPEMLSVNNLNYSSYSTILFQRLSVIVTDIVFVYGAKKCCTALKKDVYTQQVLFLLLIGNVGLLFVDHIHFQYNGIMFGILLLSIAHIMTENYILGGFWFSVLLNMKHIFAYIAPAYFIYLLRHYCFIENEKNGTVKWKAFSFGRLVKLGITVVTVFAITFGPFYDQMPQVLARLFPFKRGLCHAYWAPNFWALYNAADKFALISGNKFGYKFNISSAVMTGGLVQEYKHAVLPSITPLTTFLCTFVALVPVLIKLWNVPKVPTSTHFLRCVVICASISFLFGWHVHEKAILMVIIPLTVLAVTNKMDGNAYLFLVAVGHYSLFPLLFPPSLILIKLVLLVLHSSYAFYSFVNIFNVKSTNNIALPLLNVPETIYLLGLVGLFIYDALLHSFLGLNEKLPFLPLMLTSIYCGIGVFYSLSKYYILFLQIELKSHDKRKIKHHKKYWLFYFKLL